MGDLREKLDRVNIKDLLAIPQFVCAIPFAALLKRKRKDMWLICEDYQELFFLFLRLCILNDMVFAYLYHRKQFLLY